MPINYAVARSTIVLCDYSTGFRAPEMVKRRPVVVVSHRLPRRDGLCTVVPLSTTPPSVPGLAYVHELTLDLPLPESFRKPLMWVKADMLATVSFDRLDLSAPPASPTASESIYTRRCRWRTCSRSSDASALPSASSLQLDAKWDKAHFSIVRSRLTPLILKTIFGWPTPPRR